MNFGFPLTLGALALSACATPVARPVPGPLVVDGVAYRADLTGAGAIRISRAGQAFGYWEGAEARRVADRFCQGRVNASMRDRFARDAWEFVEGCA
ncbi:MAG: hypothetical protein U1D35_14615 [Paracoccaceae bacterium]|nr:hypothetical protein [Paracoccaceae bacterium]